MFVGQTFTLPKQLLIKKDIEVMMRNVGWDQIIKANSMGTVKLTK